MKDLDKARQLCKQVAEARIRWGKLSGLGTFTEAQVLEALVCVHKSGALDVDVQALKDDVALSNRQKGAANARASKYKTQLDKANSDYDKLRKAYEVGEQNLRELQQAYEVLESIAYPPPTDFKYLDTK